MEFVKEKDHKKREKILKTVSPQLQKALRLAWKMEVKKEVSNEEYFTKHKLPTMDWGGWNPEVELSGIEAKTIKNEGATLSDFGLYESELKTPSALLYGKDLKYSNYSEDKESVKQNLERILRGQGLKKVDIKVHNGIGSKNSIYSKIETLTSDKELQKKVKKAMKSKTNREVSSSL